MPDDLLDEINKTFSDFSDAYRDIHAEGSTDMKYLANDPWPAREKQERIDAGRPMACLDFLNQYTNQVTNDLMINKRDVQVDPVGNGANDETAQVRGDLIRQIHYESKAGDAHQCAVENAVQRSYGVWGILTDYIDDESLEQKIIVRRLPNPSAVLWDPDCKESDFSDMKRAFVLDTIPRYQFKERFPEAEIKDFSDDHMTKYSRWIQDRTVQIAEYWKVVDQPRHLFVIDQIDQQTGKPMKVYRDELAEGAVIQDGMIVIPNQGTVKILGDRKTKKRVVTQYITNGVEILGTNPWPGSWIPLFPVVGKELLVDLGGGMKRIWMSLIRLARDAQMGVNFAATNQLEIAGMSPKTKWVMYEGQIEGHEEEWQNANRSPITALQVKPLLDATGNNVLPLPQRQDYEPPIGNLEILKTSFQKAGQSAVGMYNSSIGSHDTNVKSGVAIEKLDQQSDVGTFHFTAALDRALEHEGRCMDELLEVIYDTARDVGLRDSKGNHRVRRINEEASDDHGNPYHYKVGAEKHVVTISVGPAYESERAAAKAFASKLAEIPEVFAKIGFLLVRLQNLGPIGDEISALLTPPDYQPPDGQANPKMLQSQVRQMQQLMDEMKKRIDELEAEKQAKTVEFQGKKEIEEIRAQIEVYKTNLDAFTKQEKISSDENLAAMEKNLSAVIQREMAHLAASLAPKPEPVQQGAQ